MVNMQSQNGEIGENLTQMRFVTSIGGFRKYLDKVSIVYFTQGKMCLLIQRGA